MALNKSKLILDLKKWMDDGASGAYNVPLSGVPPLISIISSYVGTGSDTFGNKIVSYTGSILQGLLMTLVVPGTSLFGAIQFSTGFNGDLAGAQIQTTIGPPDMLSPISNIISVPPLIPSTQPLFLSAFLKTHSESIVAATELGNAINDTVKQSVFTFSYIQNIPLVFPTMIVSGNIS